MKGTYTGPLERVDSCCYRIPKSFRADMRVDGLIFASEKMVETLRHDQAAEQVANVATLPGIQLASLAMPDIHWGYGFCIGGVAMRPIRRRAVRDLRLAAAGHDINCGVRLIKTNLFLDDVKQHLRGLIKAFFNTVPAGVGLHREVQVRRSRDQAHPRRGAALRDRPRPR